MVYSLVVSADFFFFETYTTSVKSLFHECIAVYSPFVFVVEYITVVTYKLRYNSPRMMHYFIPLVILLLPSMTQRCVRNNTYTSLHQRQYKLHQSVTPLHSCGYETASAALQACSGWCSRQKACCQHCCSCCHFQTA